MAEFNFFSELDIDENEPLFTSGVVCRLLSMPVWVLKMLDSKGVVSPEREERRARLYSPGDIKKLRYVWYLIEKRGVKVNGVKVILEIKGGRFEID